MSNILNIVVVLFSSWSCFQILEPFMVFGQPQKYINSTKPMIFGDM